MTNPGRKWWEQGVFVVVFVGMLAFMINSYILEQKAGKQRALYYQLALLRQGISTFSVIERHYPENLIELAMSTYKMPDSAVSHKFVEHFPVSQDGKVRDPFGNPYAYDKAKGWVMSTTQGYAFW